MTDSRTFRPFFTLGPSCERYSNWRDRTDSVSVGIRGFIESLWQNAWPYLDPDLPEKAKQSFSAAFFELDVAATLLANGLTLDEKKRAIGPDVVCTGPPRIFVEAVAATPGTEPERNPNSVPQLIHDSAQFVRHEQIILRIRNALDEKHRKHRGYINKRLLKPTDPYVIALSASPIDTAFLEMNVPDILSAVFSIGDEYVSVERTTGTLAGGGFLYRPAVFKANGSPVSTNIFRDPEYDDISGILYTACDEVNRPDVLGAGFTVIRNPRALENPIPEGFFNFGRHLIVHDTTFETRYLSQESQPLILSFREEKADG